MTTRGCACGCNDPDHLLIPPSAAAPDRGGVAGIAGPHAVIQPRTISGLLKSTYGCARAPDYLYIGTVYHPDFFVPRYPYQDRPVYRLGPGGAHRAPVSVVYPVLNWALQLPSYVRPDDVPASYDQLPDLQGWKPGEANYIVGEQYITCVREIRYYQFGNPADGIRRYIKMWDWFEYQG